MGYEGWPWSEKRVALGVSGHDRKKNTTRRQAEGVENRRRGMVAHVRVGLLAVGAEGERAIVEEV